MKQRWTDKVTYGILIAALLGNAIVGMLSVVYRGIAPAPFAYDHDRVEPVTPLLCPGELLKWELHATINRAPVVVQVYQSWWSVDEGRSAVPMPTVVIAILTEKGHIMRHVALPVPAGLSPGRYEYRLAAQESASTAQVQVVPFTIKEGC